MILETILTDITLILGISKHGSVRATAYTRWRRSSLVADLTNNWPPELYSIYRRLPKSLIYQSRGSDWKSIAWWIPWSPVQDVALSWHLVSLLRRCKIEEFDRNNLSFNHPEAHP
jgi:hypothetical protein